MAKKYQHRIKIYESMSAGGLREILYFIVNIMPKDLPKKKLRCVNVDKKTLIEATKIAKRSGHTLTELISIIYMSNILLRRF